MGIDTIKKKAIILTSALFLGVLFFSSALHAQQISCLNGQIQIDRSTLSPEAARRRLAQDEKRLSALGRILKSLSKDKKKNASRIKKLQAKRRSLQAFIRKLASLIKTCISVTPSPTAPPVAQVDRFTVQEISFSGFKLRIFRSKYKNDGIEATHLNDSGTVALRVFDRSRLRFFNFLGGELYTYFKGDFFKVCEDSDCNGDRTANFLDLSRTGNVLYRTARVDPQTGLDSSVRVSFFNSKEALKEKQRTLIAFDQRFQDEPATLVDRLGFIVAKSSISSWPDMWDYKTGVGLRGPDLLSLVEPDLVRIEDDLFDELGAICDGKRSRDFQNRQLYITENGETVCRFNSVVTCDLPTGRLEFPAISGLIRAVGSAARIVPSTVYAPGLYDNQGVRGPLSMLLAVSADGIAVMINPPGEPNPGPSRLRQAFVVRDDKVEVVDVNFSGVDSFKLEDESKKVGILGFPPAAVNSGSSFVGTRLLFYKQEFLASAKKLSEAYVAWVKNGVREVKNVDELIPRSSNIETLSAGDINSCGAIAGGARDTATGELVGYLLAPQSCGF